MSQVCIAIVDPYSSGAMLAETLLSRGVTCVAIESSPRLPSAMKSHFRPQMFAAVIAHADNIEATLSALRPHAPTHVIAGFESGVELAEQLGERLGLPGNDPAYRAARRDKFLMAEAVQRQGLRTALQFQSRNVDELLAWAQPQLTWPMIVKPTRSVASDHVHLCRTADEVREAADGILREANVLGGRNETVLIQQFLAGTEYVVDTVSYEGEAKLTAIWQYHRPTHCNDFVCYDMMELLPYEGQRQDRLRDYAFAVLQALGIRFGPAHCELIWVEDQPILVEVGARMSAGVNALLSRVCGGICQLDETVNLLLAPEEFHARGKDRPQLTRRAVNVFLMPNPPGKLIRTRHLEQLQRLPTLYSLSLATQPGDVLQRVAGRVTLVDRDPQAIARDVATIRDLERAGIFEVEVSSAG